MRFVRRQWLSRGGIPGLAALAALAAFTFGWADRLELPIRDAALRTLESRPAVATVVVAIDQKALDRIGPWPWPREELAALLHEIRPHSPEAIVIDLLLVEPSPGDELLSTLLDPSDTIVAAALTEDRTWLLPSSALRERSLPAHASLEVDHDGVLRRLMSTRQTTGLSLPAMSVLATSLREPSRPLAVSRPLMPDFSIRPESIPLVSAADLSRTDAGTIRNRIVFVGVTALGLGDRAITPVSDQPVPGVQIHAAITEALIAGRLLRPVPPWIGALIAAAIVAIAARLTRLGKWRRIVLELTLIGTPMAAGLFLLHHRGVALPIVTLTVISTITILAIEIHAAFFTAAGAARAEILLDPAAGNDTRPLAPEERVRRLLKIAEIVGEERAESSESRRVLAHELKTPLTSVRGLAQILSGFELSESETRRVANLMVKETTRLQTLIEKMLDIERIHLEPFETSATPADLSELVRGRVEILRGSGSHPIRAAVSPRLCVQGRPELLALVVDNLVGNAMKYSDPGSPIDVRLDRHGSDLVLEVEDCGSGISPEEHETIFGRFARGTSARGTEGLGLGLALAREIVAWHRGAIEVGPARFRGSIFRVRLPAAAVTSEAAS